MKRIFFVLAVSTFSISYLGATTAPVPPEENKANLDGVSISAGAGTNFVGLGGRIGYSFLNDDIHHLELGGYSGYLELVGFGADVKYSLGNNHRITFDLAYGMIGIEEVEVFESNFQLTGDGSGLVSGDPIRISTKKERIYAPSFLLGYEFQSYGGFIFNFALGVSFAEDIVPEMNPFAPAVNIGLGYKF